MFRYFFIVLTSLLLSLYSFEYYLNYSKKLPLKKKIKIYKKETGKEFETRDKIEVFLELKKKYPKLTSTIVPKWYALNQQDNLLPLSGLSNSLTLHCNENGYYSIFDSDKYGFNNPNHQWEKKEIDFFIVGDSFAMGECVNRPYDFGSVLRKNYNKVSLNLGYSSNGPNIQYAVLREYLDKRVKNILWMYYEGNDLQDLLDTSNNSKILNKYLNNSNFNQSLKFKQDELDKLHKININDQLNYFKERVEKKNKYQILRLIRLDNTKEALKKKFNQNKEVSFDESVYLKFKQVLNLSKKLAKENYSNMYFIYLPSYKRLIGKSSIEENSQKEKVISIIKELDIDLIDIEREILSSNINHLNIFPFGMYGHYNVKGYEIISDIIFNKIVKN